MVFYRFLGFGHNLNFKMYFNFFYEESKLIVNSGIRIHLLDFLSDWDQLLLLYLDIFYNFYLLTINMCFLNNLTNSDY